MRTFCFKKADSNLPAYRQAGEFSTNLRIKYIEHVISKQINTDNKLINANYGSSVIGENLLYIRENQ